MGDLTVNKPQRPTHLSDYAAVCLRALSAEGLGLKISLGGALGLLHYLDYRPTHDVDAWWAPSITAAERHQVVRVITEALQPLGAVRKRAWGEVLLDSFTDLVASRMVALVERGAPRDFRDIYALCQAGLITPSLCWQRWRERQRLAGSDTDAHQARLAVETHLARIVQHRPLEQISDPAQKAEAGAVRTWFQTEFLDALLA